MKMISRMRISVIQMIVSLMVMSGETLPRYLLPILRWSQIWLDVVRSELLRRLFRLPTLRTLSTLFHDDILDRHMFTTRPGVRQRPETCSGKCLILSLSLCM